MIDFLFLANWLFLPFFWRFIWIAAGIKLNVVSIPSILLLFIFLFQYLGLPILYFKLDPNRATLISDSNTVLYIWIYTSIAVTFLLLGFLLGKVLETKARNFTGYKFTNLRPFQSFKLTIIWVFCLLVFYFYITAIDFHKVALVILFSGENELSTDESRSIMTNAFGGSYHWYRIFMSDVYILVAGITYSHALEKPNKKKKLLLTLVTLPLIFVLLSTAEKGPIVNLFMLFFIIYCIQRRMGVVSIKQILNVFIILNCFLALLYFGFMGSKSFLDAISTIWSRILTGQIQPAYLYVELIPDKIEWLLGRTFPNPAGIFPFESFSLTTEIARIGSTAANSSVVGSAPTMFWGELYANFNWYGIAPFSLLLGLILKIFDKILSLRLKDPIQIGFYCWCILHFRDLSSTSVSNYFIDLPLVIVLFASIIIRKSYKPTRRNIVVP